jgi:hypothetical protein
MRLTGKITIVLVFISLLIPLQIFSENVGCSGNQDIKIINIAQYPRYAGCDETFDLIFNYFWEANGKKYKFNITELTLDEINGGGKHPLTNENFDLIVVGASFDSFYKHGSNPKLLESIRNFIANGGGYIGVCSGTVFATQGYETPKKFYEKYVNKRVLGIADVYLNEDRYGEAQYEFKLSGSYAPNSSLPPLEFKIVRNNSNPIFNCYRNNLINITYGGGPGLYPANSNNPLFGNVTPLLIINEELMETKPIYWYRKGILPGWVKVEKVETDLLGQYGGIATTYGKGKVVIFTGHPEIRMIVNGTIKEKIGKPSGFGFGPFFNPVRAVYSWVGTPLNMSHNWWIHRRAATWMAGVPDSDLPPCNELMVFIDKPQFRFERKFYVNNQIDDSKAAKKKVAEAGMTIIQGNITVEAYAENSGIVEFYLDSVLEYTDSNQPFTWDLDKNLDGVHRLELRAYDEYGNCAYDGSNFLFVNDSSNSGN